MKKLHILIVAVALAAVAGGVSFAAIPAADGTISACKDNKGALKVIDAAAGQGCTGNQQLLTWNQQGQQGPAGPPGPPGEVEFATAYGTSGESSENRKTVTAYCPDGQIAISGGGTANHFIGGGGFPFEAMPGVAIVESYSTGVWIVTAQEIVPTSEPWVLEVVAFCAPWN